MITKADNLRRILHGQASAWIPIEFWFDPRGEGAYTLIPYLGAQPPSQGGYDLWGARWMGTKEFLPYPAQHPAACLEQALAMPFPDIHDPRLWEEARAQAEAVRGHSLIVAWHTGGVWERLGFWWVWSRG